MEFSLISLKFPRYRNFDMVLWLFYTYVSPHKRNDVQSTIDRYDDYSREAFGRAVAHLSVTNRTQWHEPQAKKLKGKDALYEIRYRANRCSTRALGFFGGNGKTFIITLICTHKQNVYNPVDAFETAKDRSQQIVKGIATAVPLKLDGEDFPSTEE